MPTPAEAASVLRCGRWVLRGEHTGGRLALREFTLPGGWEPPRHVLLHDDLTVYVLGGRVGFACADQEDVLSAGGCAFLPSGAPRRVWNPDPEAVATVLLAMAPASLDLLLGELDALLSNNDFHDADVAQLAAAYGLVPC